MRGSRIATARILLFWSTTCTVVFLALVLPWMRRIDLKDPILSTLSHISAAIWFVVLCWSWYHLVCQLNASFKSVTPRRSPATTHDRTRFAILYLTCDDFGETCCESCIQQHYPVTHFRVIICDDSNRESFRKQVQNFSDRPNVTLFRRKEKGGFKAGNLNAAFDEEILRYPDPEDWIVIVDADQHLPQDYLDKLDGALQSVTEDVAFVQTMNRPETEPRAPGYSRNTKFQEYFGLEVDVFYHRDVVARIDYGFLPLLGHGAAIRSSTWVAVGGFPAVVSEDFAFSVRIANAGKRGVYAPEVVAYEGFPRDFSAFVIRFTKFAAGTAELFRSRETRIFLTGPPSNQKLDFLLLLAWYPLMPLVVANLFLSTFVCHRLSALGLNLLHPLLPYFFMLMLMLNVCVFWTVAPFHGAVAFWFRCVALYQSTIPAAAWSFVRYAFSGARPQFGRTPKEDLYPRYSALDVAMVGLGACGLFAAFAWFSPFSFVLASHSISHLCFPLFRWLNVPNFRGIVARMLTFLPGMLLIVALLSMWASGKFGISILSLR